MSSTETENRKSIETCPECNLFIWACKCKEPLEKRLPTDKEIRNYCDCEEIGLRVNDAFCLGFRAGWAALKDNFQNFLEAQQKKEKASL